MTTATETKPKPAEPRLRLYEPPKKGFVRYLCFRGNQVFRIDPGEVTDKGTKYTRPPIDMAFKDHICDVPEATDKLIREIAEDTDNERLDFMSKIVPAKLLGQLLEDDENKIENKFGMSYGGRQRALSFIGQMAHYSVTVSPPDKGTIEDAKIKITTEWQRRLQKWGYTTSGELLQNEEKINKIAKKLGITPEQAKAVLEEGLAK